LRRTVATGNADSGERSGSACGTRTRRGAANRSRSRKPKRSRRCANAQAHPCIDARACTHARTGIDIRAGSGTEGKTQDEIEAGAGQQTRRYRSTGSDRLRCRGQRPVRSRHGGDAGGRGKTKNHIAR
jgi:hypothetical protein